MTPVEARPVDMLMILNCKNAQSDLRVCQEMLGHADMAAAARLPGSSRATLYRQAKRLGLSRG